MCAADAEESSGRPGSECPHASPQCLQLPHGEGSLAGESAATSALGMGCDIPADCGYVLSLFVHILCIIVFILFSVVFVLLLLVLDIVFFFFMYSNLFLGFFLVCF